MLKATGIVRKVDHLGRIVLPKSLRKQFEINYNDDLEMYIDDEGYIMLEKYKPVCIFCEQNENVEMHNGKYICSSCLEELKNINI